jgi:hypothetical protein
MTDAYVDALVQAYPAIREVWLIGSRANGSAKPSSDWDYIAIADSATLKALSEDATFNSPEVDLLVVYDGDNFRKPWPDDGRDNKTGSLTGWDCQEISRTEASYLAAKPCDSFYASVSRAIAKRVR